MGGPPEGGIRCGGGKGGGLVTLGPVSSLTQFLVIEKLKELRYFLIRLLVEIEKHGKGYSKIRIPNIPRD